MTTVTSAPNTEIKGTTGNDWISSSGDNVTLSPLAGDDYVISRGNSGIINGENGNDTIIFLPTNTSAPGGGPAGAFDTTIHGNAGNDEIVVVHDSAVIYGDAGDDYITVKLYENAGDVISSIKSVTLTGGDGRDTFSFNSSLPSGLESVSTVDGARLEVLITDFSSSAHFCYDGGTSYFIYSILTDSDGNYTDIVLSDDAGKLSVTLQGVTNIDDIVYSRAIRFVDDTVETSYLGEVISNYTDDMSVIPAGITYDNYTVYVSDAYTRNVWLMGTDEVNHTSTYRNITARTLDARSSTRKRTLVGNIRANAIYAGSGGDSMWGGNSEKDTLFGGNGQDMFWYGLGDGGDIVRNFVFGSTSNSDIINLYSGGVNQAYRDNNAIHILMTTGEELVIPTDYSVDVEIQYSTDATTISRAKIGERFLENTFTYDRAVNLFMGGTVDSTLKVSDDTQDMIWLDGSYGQSYYDIKTIDASESTGNNQLAGSTDAINIIGGAGDSSLWGGNGRYSNDTMTGGEGDEMFFFGKYNGSDLILGATSDDTINLYDISLSDVTSSETVEGGVKLIFQNHEYSLTLQNYTGTPTFALAQGGNWIYDNKEWKLKE